MQQLLQAVRDEVVEAVTKKQNVQLNFAIGTLHLTSAGKIEFKSTSTAPADTVSQTHTRLTEAGLREL